MDLQSIYQVIYTVLFVLAGVLLAASVFVFFQFRIPDVIEDLSGVKIGKRKSTVSAKPTRRARPVKVSGLAKNVTQPTEGTAPMPVERSAEGGSNTVWLDERQTENLAPENDGERTEMCRTMEMTATAGLTGPATQSMESINEAARKKLEFRPVDKVLVAQTMERI